MTEQLFVGLHFFADYRNGDASVEDLLHVCRSYAGPAPHFLLSPQMTIDEDIGGGPVLEYCLSYMPEEELVVVLEALIVECPQVLTLKDDKWGGLLHLALEHSSSRRIQLLLAVPQSTRLLDGKGRTPLLVACANSPNYKQFGVEPNMIHHLFHLDPDALALQDNDSRVPLHYALSLDPLCALVQRMIEMHPQTLLCRDKDGQTPVQLALEEVPFEFDDGLARLVEQFPRSVALPDNAPTTQTSLVEACEVRASHPELVRAVLEADPTALVIAHLRPRNVPWEIVLEEEIPDNWLDFPREYLVPCLPFELARGEGLAKFVRDETARFTLALVEYMLPASAVPAAAAGDSDLSANVAWFQGHIKDTLHELFPEVPLEGVSGLSVAQALQACDGDDDDNNGNATMVALIKALFCQDKARELLDGDRHLLRSVVLSEAVVDLYRLNRQGRYWPSSAMKPTPPLQDAKSDDDYDASVAAAMHQVDLLASLQDSETVDATYLQVREVAHRALIVQAEHRGLRRLSRKRPAAPSAESDRRPESTLKRCGAAASNP